MLSKSGFFLACLIMAGGGFLNLSITEVHGQTPPPAPGTAESTDTTVAVDPNYLLASGDQISVSVYGESSLGASAIIDRSGKIRLPLLGEVTLSGLNVRNAESLLEKTYITEELLKDPEVTVRMQAYAVRELIILGAVRGAGTFKFPTDSTSLDIRDVISRIGGFTPVARADSVTVTRRDQNGVETTKTVDLQNLQSGRTSREQAAPFLVYPGDRIFVPERLF